MKDLFCVSCKNELYKTGFVFESSIGPLVACDVCRTLYYLEISPATEDHGPIAVFVPTKLEPESEFDLIRAATNRTPLTDYLLKQILPEIPKEERIVNPHFNDEIPENKTLKNIIESSSTPSELLEKLKFYE